MLAWKNNPKFTQPQKNLGTPLWISFSVEPALHDGRIALIFGIADATIVVLEPTLTADAPHEIAIDGRLTIAAFVNGQPVNPFGDVL
ncbi:MAG: hypothetical protein R2932_53150 [Caldilineaceae bacterium]